MAHEFKFGKMRVESLNISTTSSFTTKKQPVAANTAPNKENIKRHKVIRLVRRAQNLELLKICYYGTSREQKIDKFLDKKSCCRWN